MPRSVFIVLTNCTDTSREQEFNRWYTHTHLPDLSKARGLASARRFVNVSPAEGAAKYMTLYEFEGDDIKESVKDLLRLALEAFAKGRHIDCIAGAPPGEGPLIFQEIDPRTLEPLEQLHYPIGVPEEIRAGVEALLRS